MKSVVIVFLAVVVTAYAQNFKCPKSNGVFEDPIQCDQYYDCSDGVATVKLCPDGLVFDPLIRKVNKCENPFLVDCGDRTELQPARPTKLCPRQNGYFAHPNPSNCNTFYNCIQGEAIEMKCTNGLHYEELNSTCVWPANAGREGCDDTKLKKLKDGFECSKEVQTDANGQLVIHPKYAHPTDCQRFYVCLNGDEPRDLGCQVGEVYNEETQKCDAPENVPGCENWYKDDPAVPPKAVNSKQS